MHRSTDRILTTHAGSLARSREIVRGMKARTAGQDFDQDQLTADIERGITEVVRHQVDIGIDVPNDGELGRRGFMSYIHERLGGLEPRLPEAGENVYSFEAERELYPEFFERYYKFYRYMWMYPEIDMEDVAATRGDSELFTLTSPVFYRGQAAVQRDIARLQQATRGLPVADVFITAITPTSRKSDRNVEAFYASEEAYLYALADALHEEYQAITDAGCIVQLDWAALNPQGQLLIDRPDAADSDMRKARERAVELVNYALRGIPEDRVRYHHCWGSHNRPHTTDSTLEEILPQLLKINAQAYSIEAANPRHEHEWMLWKDVKLPDGKILIPGVISHQTNVVEHPRLVAWRIENFASVVGKENVIAGADCGFSQWWDSMRVHPSVQWAKLQALVDGASLASRKLWGR
jgi:5-methyltetrahydropteroyltriglutamate--homocysteine methyltransferase